MTTELNAMIVAALVTLVAGLVLARSRVAAAAGVEKLIVLGPVFYATALAAFAAEHFTDARDMMNMVPKFLPAPLAWTYFVGVALFAAAISFVAWRCVRWSSLLLAVMFVLFVLIFDVPALPTHLHDRLTWVLTFRELSFASGALVLAGSLWPQPRVGVFLAGCGRTFLGATLVFYALQHFLHLHNVPGVPLEKLIPAGFPAPVVLSGFVGLVLLLCGTVLWMPRWTAISAAVAGGVLVLLTALFYVPILVMELHTPLAIEGMNYVGDTLLFAGTVLLAAFGADFSAAHVAVD